MILHSDLRYTFKFAKHYYIRWASLVGSAGEESTCNAGDPGLTSGSGKSRDGIGYLLQYSWASLTAQMVKNWPAMQETWFDPLAGKIS